MKKIKTYLSRRLKIIISRYFYKLIVVYTKFKIKKTFRNNKEIFLVYSIGKVGSSSIYNTLKQKDEFKKRTFHVHALNENRIKEQKDYYRKSKRKSVPYHLILSSRIAQELKSYEGKVNVITLIREPISRELSSVFQDSFNFTSSYSPDNELIMSAVKDKVNKLKKELPEVEWFNNELKHVFGIDIFKNDIELKNGYFVSKSPKLNFALIRLENLNNIFQTVMGEILPNIALDLVVANEARDKFYNEAYNKIRSKVKLSNEELNVIFSSAYVQKFYDDMEEGIKRKWLDQ